ncbi:hypothetical protein I79_019808 [Cricetulus griseus]|uniref:Uncharacterized protein n=1 Tax=Cricetulus griseus TaxID=10029 RepID=G3I8E4_CRIGR|nr:hypothetical protein I79_019808 [Cricetulus griseus]
MTKATLTKGNIQLGLPYSFRRLVHDHRGRKQTDLALEQQLRALHPDLQAEGRETGLGMDF